MIKNVFRDFDREFMESYRLVDGWCESLRVLFNDLWSDFESYGRFIILIILSVIFFIISFINIIFRNFCYI